MPSPPTAECAHARRTPQGGCAEPAHNLSAPHRGCQLVHQEPTQPGTGRALLLVRAPALTGGAPLRYAAPEVPGFTAHPGLGFWYRRGPCWAA